MGVSVKNLQNTKSRKRLKFDALGHNSKQTVSPFFEKIKKSI